MPLTVVRRESMHLYAREPKTQVAKDAVDALLRVQRTEEQEIEAARSASGLTNNEFHAVRYMLQAHRDGRPMGPKDLAVMLDVSNASITKLVDALVDKGDFVRIAHPTDRRAQYLEPTEQAAKKIDDAYARFHAVVVRVMDGLPEEDAATLTRCLGAISDALVAESPELVAHEEAVEAEGYVPQEAQAAASPHGEAHGERDAQTPGERDAQASGEREAPEASASGADRARVAESAAAR